VVEVPPLRTSRERLSRPGQGKTDPVDAVAIARITARESCLPPVRPMTGEAADLRVLTEYRDQLVNERTALANRVHTDLGWLWPGYQHQLPHLTNMAHLRAALELLSGDDSMRAAVTRSRLEWMLTLTERLRELRIQIDPLAFGSFAPVVGAGLGVATDLGDRHGVERPVQLAVPAALQAVSHGATGGGRDGRGPVGCREVVPGGVAAHVEDVADDCPRPRRHLEPNLGLRPRAGRQIKLKAGQQPPVEDSGQTFPRTPRHCHCRSAD
jgi:Transposase